MNENDEKRRKNYLKKLVSNSRAILSHQISLPLGSLKMSKILYWIENIEQITELHLKVFTYYNNETSDYPIGEDRQRYNAEFLAELDVKLDKITWKYKDEIEQKCHEIINEFGAEKK